MCVCVFTCPPSPYGETVLPLPSLPPSLPPSLLPVRLLAVGADCLFVAACTGDSEAIRHLVTEEGVSPSHEFQQGVTALHEACEGGFEECVSILIELGAEVNKQVSYVV